MGEFIKLVVAGYLSIVDSAETGNLFAVSVVLIDDYHFRCRGHGIFEAYLVAH